MITYDFKRCVISWHDFDGNNHELPAEICWDDTYNTWLEPDKEQIDPELYEKYLDEREIVDDFRRDSRQF